MAYQGRTSGLDLCILRNCESISFSSFSFTSPPTCQLARRWEINESTTFNTPNPVGFLNKVMKAFLFQSSSNHGIWPVYNIQSLASATQFSGQRKETHRRNPLYKRPNLPQNPI